MIEVSITYQRADESLRKDQQQKKISSLKEQVSECFFIAGQ
jgi:hypothetical protein